ncbi:hypothetical protein [Mesorhizobium sp. M1143]
MQRRNAFGAPRFFTRFLDIDDERSALGIREGHHSASNWREL